MLFLRTRPLAPNANLPQGLSLASSSHWPPLIAAPFSAIGNLLWPALSLSLILVPMTLLFSFTPPHSSYLEAAETKEMEKQSTIAQSALLPRHYRMETTLGIVEIELYPLEAPLTCANFVHHVEAGTYHQEASFYRVIDQFVIQGGVDGAHPGRSAKHKTVVNESTPSRRNIRGALAMARCNNVDSATTEFYINHKDNPQLDARTHDLHNGYTVFGRVTKGMEVVDRIAKAPTDLRDCPLEPIQIIDIRSFVPKSADHKEQKVLSDGKNGPLPSKE